MAEVADDPEGAEVLSEIRVQRQKLPAEPQARVHLACLPMDDVDENAAMVNAIQRRADVRDSFLGTRHLAQYMQLIEAMLTDGAPLVSG